MRQGTFDDGDSLEKALQGCDRLFLVSSPRVEMDFFDAPYGQGREKDHFTAIEAARKAGVKHIYYTSLAFANPSKSNVMTAHERTEQYLKDKWDGSWTIIREGLYNESWPLYFGHYDLPNDDRTEIIVGGDGPASWTSIADLGLGTAIVLSEPVEKWTGKTFYLANTQNPKSLSDIVTMVSTAKGKDIALKVVPRAEHERHHIEDRGETDGMIKWWAKTYDALPENECKITDGTLEELLSRQGRKPTPLEETLREMLNSAT